MGGGHQESLVGYVSSARFVETDNGTSIALVSPIGRNLKKIESYKSVLFDRQAVFGTGEPL